MKTSRLRLSLVLSGLCLVLVGVLYQWKGLSVSHLKARQEVNAVSVSTGPKQEGKEATPPKQTPRSDTHDVISDVMNDVIDDVIDANSDVIKGGSDVSSENLKNKTAEADSSSSKEISSGALRCALKILQKQGMDDKAIQHFLNKDAQIGEDIADKKLAPDAAIPHTIHQIWRTEYVHKSFAGYIKSWADNNPGWKHVFWTHESARHFIASVYPQYLSLYDSYGADIYRADVARYFILYTFGGVYMDLDIESLKPLDVVDRHSCLISQEPNIHRSLGHKRDTTMASNALMGCRKGHPFFKQVIHTLPDFNRKTTDLLGSTGPLMLDKSYKDYFAQNPKLSDADDLFVAPGSYFQPSFDEMNRGDFKERCSALVAPVFPEQKCQEFLAKIGPSVLAKQVVDCKALVANNFANTPEAPSYSNHYWVHSYWYPLKFTGKNNTLNVSYKELKPNVILGASLVSQLTTT